MKKNIPSIILYAFAVFFTFYAIWSLIRTGSALSSAIALGQIVVTGSEFEIFSVIMSNGFQFIMYSLLLAAAGLILQKIQKIACALVIPVSETQVEVIVEEEDDFFQKGESKEDDSEAEK